jgi:hypothetical protein
MRAPKEVDWDAVYDDRHLPDITMADHIRNAGPDPKISPEDDKRWLRTTLQVNARKKRIDTMEHGPKRTALKKQQRLEIDLLNREILITHGRPFYSWTMPKGILHLEFDPAGKVGAGKWDFENDARLEIQIYFKPFSK